MKRTAPNTVPTAAVPARPDQDTSLAIRFRLAMLDEHLGENRGYNPYDAATDGKKDVWRAKRKRG